MLYFQCVPVFRISCWTVPLRIELRSLPAGGLVSIYLISTLSLARPQKPLSGPYVDPCSHKRKKMFSKDFGKDGIRDGWGVGESGGGK